MFENEFCISYFRRISFLKLTDLSPKKFLQQTIKQTKQTFKISSTNKLSTDNHSDAEFVPRRLASRDQHARPLRRSVRTGQVEEQGEPGHGPPAHVRLQLAARLLCHDGG